jgi:hypothetical protein
LHRRRRLPVYAPEFEKAAIEPGSEEMTQVGVERLQARLTAQVREQILAHGYQRRGAALRHVHSAQQFLTGRFGRLGELAGAFGRWLREVGLRSRPELGLLLEIAVNARP